jgi:serine/threonine-protein kinase
VAVKTIDRFVLKDIVSDGSAGTVYRAEEILPGDAKRVVALKVLPLINPNDADKANRFFGEVKVLAQLAVHPHVVTIYAMGVTENYPWLAMEYAEQTLANRVGEEPTEPREVMKVMEQVGRGLMAMHSLKPALVHQDLKPANVLVDVLGNYKITDFSLASAVGANRTHGLATVRYAAPELLTSEYGKVGPATDLYALGHIAYELSLGTRQHVKQFPAVFEGNSSKEPPPNKWMMWHASINTKAPAVEEVRKEFPRGLSEIIARLMAKPLGHRYASAAEMLEDLGRVRDEMNAPVVTPSRAVAPPAVPTPGPIAAPAASTTPVPPPSAPAAAAAAPVESVAATMASGPTVRYWVRSRGRVTGPFDFAGLQKQAKAGTVSRFHQISTDQVNWKGATEIEGLYGPTVV